MMKTSGFEATARLPGRATRLPGLLVLLCLSCQVTAGKLHPYQGLDETPVLTLEDLGRVRHSLQDYHGQVVLVNFWASWCGPCIIEMPSLERLQQAMNGKPFTVLAVNVGESHGTVWNFAARFQLTFPMLLDYAGQTASDWEVDVYPSTFLIGPHGRVQSVAYGPRNWDEPEMIQAIGALFDISATSAQTVK